MSYEVVGYPEHKRQGKWTDAGFSPLPGFSASEAFEKVTELQMGFRYVDGITEGAPQPTETLPSIESCTSVNQLMWTYHEFVAQAFKDLRLEKIFTQIRYLPAKLHADINPHVDSILPNNSFSQIVLASWPNPTRVLQTGTELPVKGQSLLDGGDIREDYLENVLANGISIGESPAIMSAKNSIHWHQPQGDPDSMRLLLRSAIFY